MEDIKQSVNEKTIDLTQLKLISRGNHQFIEKMLSLFVSMVPKNIANLSNYLDEAEWQKLGDLAHSMKPTVDTLSIGSVKGPIRKLEKIAKSGESPEKIRQLTEMIICQLQFALTDAKEILDKNK